MTYPEYLNEIITEYYSKRDGGLLNPALLNPTPARLKEESNNVYRDRFDKKDLKNLGLFFEVSKEEQLARAIKLFPTDRFKPLANFLIGVTKESEDKNIELLGWLIDFQPRPVEVWKRSHGSSAVGTKLEEVDGDVGVISESMGDSQKAEQSITQAEIPNPSLSVSGGTPVGPVGNSTRNLLTRKAAVILTISILSIVIGSWYLARKPSPAAQCMVWSDDRYKRIDCDSVPSGALALAFDEKLVRGMRRVTNTDTITEKHCGIFGYRKRGRDSLDIYTMIDRDPSEPTKHLKALTPYMLDHYVFRKHNTSETTLQ